jgi:16S rRNA (uracil1498-N3)-methyltransferase
VNPTLRTSAAHVFVDSLTDPVIDADDEHHLRRVLRITDADTVTIGDGAGNWAAARLMSDGLVIDGERCFEPAPRPTSVVCAIPKGDRPEWIVQKLTEIGVTSIGFMECARSVVRWDGERGRRHTARLRRIAREAAMQSRRLWLPAVNDVVAYGVAVASPNCAVADPDGRELDNGVDTMLIGPEGGFTPAELAVAPRRVSLSTHILRVETAAMTGAFMLTQSHQRE